MESVFSFPHRPAPWARHLSYLHSAVEQRQSVSTVRGPSMTSPRPRRWHRNATSCASPWVVDRAVLRTTMRRNLAVTTTLAVAAAETSRVHLGTSVAVPLLRTTHITIRNRALANQGRSGTARPIPPMQYATTVVCAGGVIDNPLVSPNSFEWL